MDWNMPLNFLPVDRMKQLGPSSRESYLRATPYPHIVFDDFFDPSILSRIVEEFPKPTDPEWSQYKNAREVKLASNRDEHFGPTTKLFLYNLNAAPFLNFLTEVTGIEGLIADSHFDGGGMHQIQRGGKLAVHADFNKSTLTQLDRRLNALIYLNPDWQPDYGGNLELWNSDMTACVEKIAPRFNRLVIFSTTDTAYHGHPDALMCPPDMTRKSLALYYYTNGRPADEASEAHSTLFRARPGEDLNPMKARVKDLAKDILPPMLTRFIGRYT